MADKNQNEKSQFTGYKLRSGLVVPPKLNAKNKKDVVVESTTNCKIILTRMTKKEMNQIILDGEKKDLIRQVKTKLREMPCKLNSIIKISFFSVVQVI